MRNDLFTPVASLPLLVDVWALHVSFVFNLRPRMGARQLQLHLTPPASSSLHGCRATEDDEQVTAREVDVGVLAAKGLVPASHG